MTLSDKIYCIIGFETTAKPIGNSTHAMKITKKKKKPSPTRKCALALHYDKIRQRATGSTGAPDGRKYEEFLY